MWPLSKPLCPSSEAFRSGSHNYPCKQIQFHVDAGTILRSDTHKAQSKLRLSIDSVYSKVHELCVSLIVFAWILWRLQALIDLWEFWKWWHAISFVHWAGGFVTDANHVVFRDYVASSTRNSRLFSSSPMPFCITYCWSPTANRIIRNFSYYKDGASWSAVADMRPAAAGNGSR